MDRKHLILSVLLMFPAVASATATYTPLLNLCKPGENDYDWLDCVNNNFDILDSSNVQTNASGLTTGQVANSLLYPSSVTLYGPWIPAEKIQSGTLRIGTSVQSYVDGSIKGPAIAASTIPLNAINPSGCTAGQTITLSGGVWVCGNSTVPANVAVWTKYTASYTDFRDAAYKQGIVLATLSAKTVIHAVVIKHSTSFRGGGITHFLLATGIGTTEPDRDTYSSGFDVYSIPADDNFEFSYGARSDNYTTSWSFYLNATTEGATLDTADQGEAEIWLYTSSLP